VLLKEAGHETRRLRAMTSAWELKEVKHYQKLLHHLHQCDKDNLQTFKTFIDSLDDLIRFKHHEYSEEVGSMATSDLQLSVLELEVQARLDTHVGKSVAVGGSASSCGF
jgi:hypothetical protein